jgi:hypothetical protein
LLSISPISPCSPVITFSIQNIFIFPGRGSPVKKSRSTSGRV